MTDKTVSYDLFLTHAWRFHDDWSKFCELLDNTPNLMWRNFSLPWHDPAMDPNKEVGGQFIRNFLESQIIPSQVVILLSGVYQIKSARRWLDMEVEMAKQHNKPIIGVPSHDTGDMPDEVKALCDSTCAWDSEDLVKTIEKVQSLEKYSNIDSNVTI